MAGSSGAAAAPAPDLLPRSIFNCVMGDVMSDITAEDQHDLIVSWGTKWQHDQSYPHCTEVHHFELEEEK